MYQECIVSEGRLQYLALCALKLENMFESWWKESW